MDAVSMKEEAEKTLAASVEANQKARKKREANTPEALLKKAEELKAQAEALRIKQEQKAAEAAAKEEEKRKKQEERKVKLSEKTYPLTCEKIQALMEGHRNEKAMREAWAAWVELYEDPAPEIAGA